MNTMAIRREIAFWACLTNASLFFLHGKPIYGAVMLVVTAAVCLWRGKR
jgi:hypothetical protein